MGTSEVGAHYIRNEPRREALADYIRRVGMREEESVI